MKLSRRENIARACARCLRRTFRACRACSTNIRCVREARRRRLFPANGIIRPPGDIRLSEHRRPYRAPLTEPEWDDAACICSRTTSRELLRLRFGQAADFADDRTLERFFGIKGNDGEMIWMLEEGGTFAPLRISFAYRRPTPRNRFDCSLGSRAPGNWRKAVAHYVGPRGAAGIRHADAFVLHENIPMLRLARKVGFEARKSSGLSVDLEFDLGQLQRAAGTALADAGVSVNSIEAVAC